MNSAGSVPSPLRCCVFCGNRPHVKTIEHVLPQWLMELTGDSGRQVRFEMQPGQFKKISFNNIAFPACQKCNQRYSRLEDNAQRVIRKLLKKEALCGHEAEQLLDWFDKLRVGLWLGGCMLSRNWLGVNPRFAIAERIRATDRLLYIGYVNTTDYGLAVSLLTDPVFVLTPSFLSVYINGFLFISFSFTSVAAPNLGLPYVALGKVAFKGELPCAEANVIIPTKKIYGGAFPATASGFAIIAQAIAESKVFPLSDEVRGEFEQTGINPSLPSTIHCFRGGVADEIEVNPQHVLDSQFISRDELLLQGRGLFTTLRKWIVERMADPVPNQWYCNSHFVKQAEKVVPYSTVWFRDSIPELAKTYLEVLRGQLEIGKWKEQIARLVPCNLDDHS